MDERELVGLLYRADWARLALAGTVRGSDTGVHTLATEADDGAGSGRSWSMGTFGPPFPQSGDAETETDTDTDTDTERTLIVAPGKRYREESAAGSYASGCDGERIWQWYGQLRPGLTLRFDPRPRPPVPVLLAPSWLLTGYELTLGVPVEEETGEESRRSRYEGPANGIGLGVAARSAADAVKKQVDEKVATARGFLDSFLGGGR